MATPGWILLLHRRKERDLPPSPLRPHSFRQEARYEGQVITKELKPRTLEE